MSIQGNKMTKKKTKPIAKCFDSNWVYVRAVETDVLKRFKSLGWKAPSELRIESSTGAVNN
jgi:hypothetical protein